LAITPLGLSPHGSLSDGFGAIVDISNNFVDSSPSAILYAPNVMDSNDINNNSLSYSHPNLNNVTTNTPVNQYMYTPSQDYFSVSEEKEYTPKKAKKKLW